MEFIVASRHEAECGIAVRCPYAVISITDPHTRRPRIPKSVMLRGVLFLKFHDAEDQANGDVILMTHRQARQIWRFIRQHSHEIGALIVHCEQGTSRSPAVAAAVCKMLGGDPAPFFADYSPNQYVYDLVLSASRLSARRSVPDRAAGARR